MKRHIAILGPVAGPDVASLLPAQTPVPQGYEGAPFMGTLIRGLLARGHRVTAITTDVRLGQNTVPVDITAGSFRLIVCPSRPRAWRPNGLQPGRAFDMFRVEVTALARSLEGVDADVVHAHWSYEFALAALRCDPNALVTCHDSPRQVFRYTRNAYRAMRYLMALRVFRQARHFTTVSDYMAGELASGFGIKARVVPNPVADFVLSLGQPRRLTGSRRIAMVCNGWNDIKNAERGLEAFAAWAASLPEAELHLFGHGYGLNQAAYKWVVASSLPRHNLIFHGPKLHADLIAALNTMDALLHPALEESFGVVVAEAMALGLPVVGGHASGAVPSVLGDHATRIAGVLTDVTSSTAMIQALDRVFGPDYEQFSLAGVNRARDVFSSEAVVSAYVSCYQGLGQASSRH